MSPGGFGRQPNVTHARSAHKQESQRSREATIEIPVYFNRTFILIPTGCALRWAQKDEGGFPQPPYIPLDSHTPFETLGSNKYVKESKVLSLCTRASKSQLCFCALKTGAV